MATKVKLATRGLIGGPNEHTVDGAMRRANNVVCRRPNVIEPRPGFRVASWDGGEGGTQPPQQLLGVGGSADLVVYESGAARYRIGPVSDLGESYDSYTAGFGSDVYFPSRSMINGVDSRGNVYYNTRGHDGDFPVADSPRGRVADGDELHPMGYPAIPPTPSFLNLTSAGSPVAIPVNEYVAYRFTLENKLGDVLRVSVPSGRTVAGAGANALRVDTTKMYLPAQALAGDTARAWRSYGSAVLPPSDQLFLTWSKELDATDISNGYVEWSDNNADADLGQALYTNPEREGPRSSNFRPPACNALASFQGSVLFGGVTGPHRYKLRWRDDRDCTGDAAGIGFRTADGSIDGAAASTISGATTTGLKVGMLLSDPDGWSGTGYPRITNISAGTITTTHIYLGPGGVIPGGVYWLDSVRISCADGSGDDSYYPISSGSFSVSGPGVIASTVTAGYPYTAAIAPPHEFVAAYNITDHYDSGASVPPIVFAEVMLEKYACDGSEFEVWATHGDEYDPPLPEPTVADGNVSEADDWSDAVYYSKRNEPEHVPLGNYLRVGTLGKAVLAMKATKDGVFIFKEDGVYMFSGAGARSGFRSDPVMPSCLILTPKCASEMHGDVYAWTNLGLVSFGAGGFRVVDSGALSHELKLQQESIGTCVTDDKYSVFMATDPRTMEVFLGAWLPPTTIDGEFPAEDGQNDRSAALYVYNARTSCWTTWGAGSTPCRFTEGVVCGLASPDESLEGNTGGMLFGVGYANEVLYEMTDPAHSAFYPFVDNYEALPAAASAGVDVTHTAPASGYSPKAGDVIYRADGESRVVLSVGSNTAVVHAGFEDELADDASIGEGYESSVAWVAESADHAGFLKFWESIVFLFGELSRVWSWKFLTRSSHPGMDEAESEHTETTYLDDNSQQARFEAKPRRVYVHRDNAHGASLYVEWRILNGGARWTMNGGTVNYDPVSERI